MAKRVTHFYCDPETGEVIDTTQYVELEPGDVVFTQKQQEFLRKKNARYQDKTDFVWLSFQYGSNFDFPVDPAVLVRFLYFGTACGNDGVIQKNKLMDARLELNKNQQTAFFKQTVESGLLQRDGTALFVDPQVISRGEYTAGLDHIRVFSVNYRKLCESTTSQSELKQIYHFIQMIPYLNRQTNILSYNQTEQEIERVVYMPFKEFCDKIGYNTAHTAKLKKMLLSFRVDDELVVGFFDNLSELSPKGSNVVLNPKLFFGGDRSREQYRLVCTLFENEKNSRILTEGNDMVESDV